jgi:3-methyl-2-oxobutanoate hydroxymethyltransferase
MTKRLTIADLLALRGRRQLSMLRVETLDEAAAAENAGVDMISAPIALHEAGLRRVAPTIFTFPNLDYGIDFVEDDCVRAAFRALRAGGDAIYCAARLQTIRRLADEGIPVCGHVGLIPSKATWTGGFRAVGKTLETAKLVWRQVRALEEAGAFAAEIEVVPEEIAAEIARHSSLFLISMGAGAHGHAQYLFSDDVLGANSGHIPRHAKIYRDFAAEFARLQAERVAAYGEFARDVTSGAYPAAAHKVRVDRQTLSEFRSWLTAQPRASGPTD